jgi:apolipoprotein N-acyltransferase
VIRGRRAALAAGYALATFLSFPHHVGGGPVDLGLAVAWLSPALLILCVRGLSPGRAAGWGFLASWAAHTAVLHWIYVVTVVYGHAPAFVGVLAPAGLAVYIALFGAAFGAGAAFLAQRGLASPLALAALWAVLDHLRAFALTGFPWATLGYAQHLNPLLLPWAAWGGVYALSFWVALGGAALAALAVDGRRALRPAGLALGGVAAAHLVGLGMRFVETPPEPYRTLRVAVLQGNIDQGVKWSRDWSERALDYYEALTREARADGARVVVWPETAVPGALEADAAARARLAALARETGAQLVVGSVGVAWDERGRPEHFYDSAFLVEPSGEITDRYDKTHLVPFGEYVPFRSLIGLFVSAVARGIASSDVSPGERPRHVLLQADESPFRVGIPICFELLFPHLVRQFAVDGARLLLAITNDAWYGRTGAPHQFLAITALRSAETGLWTARAANTGVSGFIDGQGHVRSATPIFERTWRAADVPLHPDPARATFYVRHGDVFAGLCWLGTAAVLAWGLRRPRVREAGR